LVSLNEKSEFYYCSEVFMKRNLDEARHGMMESHGTWAALADLRSRADGIWSSGLEIRREERKETQNNITE